MDKWIELFVSDRFGLYFESQHQVSMSCSPWFSFVLFLSKKKEKKRENQTLFVYSCVGFKVRLTSRRCRLPLNIITSLAAATKATCSKVSQRRSSPAGFPVIWRKTRQLAELHSLWFQECDRTQRTYLLFPPFASFFLGLVLTSGNMREDKNHC